MSSASAASEPSLIVPDWADRIPEDWTWRNLEAVCDAIVDCPHSTPQIVERSEYLMARTSDILTGVFRTDEARRVSEATYLDRVRRLEPKHGDLLYSREGTYFGLAAEVPPDTKVCLGQRMVLLRPDPRKVHHTYLTYWLNSPGIQSHIHGHRDGSVAERLNMPTIRRLPVATPSLDEQRAIAHILGTLDDKIELNRRMNETLEAIARALFKSWFVDFDPVRAKAEGRETGLPKDIADLFPDSFEDSDLGEVPKEWRGTTWGEVVTLEYGKSLRGYQEERGQYPVYGTNGTIGTHTAALCAHPGVVIGRKGAYRGVHYSDTPFYVIDTAFFVEPIIPVEMRWVYYQVLRQDINSMDSGSAIPSTSRSDFYGLPVLYPPPEIQAAYAAMLRPCWDRQVQVEHESHRLSKLRDALLPQLISGVVRVVVDNNSAEVNV